MNSEKVCGMKSKVNERREQMKVAFPASKYRFIEAGNYKAELIDITLKNAKFGETHEFKFEIVLTDGTTSELGRFLNPGPTMRQWIGVLTGEDASKFTEYELDNLKGRKCAVCVEVTKYGTNRISKIYPLDKATGA